MAQHNDIGKNGEQAAVEYLQDNGYQILDRNVRLYGIEVDIIARDRNGDLVFVEVKTRTKNLLPANKLFSFRQRQRIVRAADFYVRKHEMDANVRFDVIFVSHRQGEFIVEHIPAAFHPQW